MATYHKRTRKNSHTSRKPSCLLQAWSHNNSMLRRPLKTTTLGHGRDKINIRSEEGHLAELPLGAHVSCQALSDRARSA